MTQVLLLRLLWVFGGLVLVACGVSGCVAWTYRPSKAARDMIRPHRSDDAPERIESAAKQLAEEGVELRSLELESTHARPEEGVVRLRGWFLRTHADPEADRCILFVHGLGFSRTALEDWVRFGLNQGWNAALFDLRGHGISDGDYRTFGYLESREVADQVRLLQTELGQRQVVLLGYSLGGAISALALEHVEPGTVEGVIAVGAYADFVGMTDDYFRMLTRGLSTASWRREVLAEGERLLGASADTLSPALVLPTVSDLPPALVIHGTEDRLVKPDHGKELAEAFNGRACLVWIEGADHGNIWEQGGESLRRDLSGFLRGCSARAERGIPAGGQAPASGDLP